MGGAATIAKEWRAAKKAAKRRVSVRINLPVGPADPKDKNTWTTPDYLYWFLDSIFQFALDPCCFPWTALCPFYHSEQGLEKAWFGRVFMNPPFGRGKLCQWLQKACEECRDRQVIVVGLIPHSCDTAMWRKWVAHPNVEIVNPPGRIRYGGVSKSPNFASTIIIFWPSAVFGERVVGSPSIENQCLRTYARFKLATKDWVKQTVLTIPEALHDAIKLEYSRKFQQSGVGKIGRCRGTRANLTFR